MQDNFFELLEDFRKEINKINRSIGRPEVEQKVWQCDECGKWTTKIIHINNEGSFCSECRNNGQYTDTKDFLD